MQDNGRILSISHIYGGRTHDFKIRKQERPMPRNAEKYIDLGYLRTIQNNRFTSQESQGASREGSALLQGIVYCKRCGQKMRPRYTSQHYYYCCDRDHRRFGVSICGWASAGRVDAVIEEHVLQVFNEGTVDLTFMVMENHRDAQTAFEGKVAQRAIILLLGPTYEQDFKVCSFGFRPRKSPHQAFQQLRTDIMERNGRWIIDVDLHRFFVQYLFKHSSILINGLITYTFNIFCLRRF